MKNKTAKKTVGPRKDILISEMTGKLLHMRAINCNPLAIKFCNIMAMNQNNICSKCYSRFMIKTCRQACNKPWTNNGLILSKTIIKPMPLNDDIFRLHAHGELINQLHFINLLSIVNYNPDVNFALWTKRKNIVCNILKNNKKPENLQLIYSNPTIDTAGKIPKHFDKVFNVYTKENSHNVDINCGKKKCFECQECYKPNNTKVINELIK